MNLLFHKPRPSDWPVCRMLLPGSVADAGLREFCLALDASNRSLVGALSFADDGRKLDRLQFHVVSSQRRQGIEGRLLEHAQQQAVERGREEITTFVDQQHSQLVNGFLEESGFRVAGRVLTAEGDLREVTRRQRERCQRAQSASSRDEEVVSFSPELLRGAGQLLAEFLADVPSAQSHYFHLVGDAERLALSRFLIVNGSIEGMALLSRNGETVSFDARVVKPAFRLHRSGAALVMRALEAAIASGATRLRFRYFDSAKDTAAVVRRLGLPVVWSAFRFHWRPACFEKSAGPA